MSSTAQPPSPGAPAEKPENGLRGLRHWRHDLVAGLQVALVSLPLSLGIAIASGAPPVTGIVSAVIAGAIYPFIGGAYVTISGPAAGLAPALLAGMLLLGEGDLAAGYPLLLVAIFLTGLTQLLLTALRAGRFALFLPQTVVEAMLAAIGFIIIVKQLPLLLGVAAPPKKSVLESVQALPAQLGAADPAVLLLGLASLAVMVLLSRARSPRLRLVPPPLAVAVLGVLGGAALGLGPEQRVAIPDGLVESVRLPAFGEVLARPGLWWSLATVVVTLTLIDGIESLATIRAVDRIDPWQRRSDPNRTLGAMGLSNVLSSMLGGLTIIPGGIKSRANVDGGGRTLWSNFYNAIFLLLLFFLARDVINRIPLATLAAILVFIGWRLCEPRVFLRALAMGRDQLLVFAATVMAILATDLLSGILIGAALYGLLMHALLSPSLDSFVAGKLGGREALRAWWEALRTLFRDPVLAAGVVDGPRGPEREVQLGSLFATNLLRLESRLARLPAAPRSRLVLSRSGRMICSSAMEHLHHLQEQAVEAGGACEIVGLDHYRPFSAHPNATRRHEPELARAQVLLSTRQARIAAFAAERGLRFEPGPEACLNERHLIYLSNGSDRMTSNVVTGRRGDLEVELFDYTFLKRPLSYLETQRTIVVLRPAGPVPDLVLLPEPSWVERYTTGMAEVSLDELALGTAHRAHGADAEAIRAYLGAGDRRALLREHPKLHVEARGGVVLALRVDRYPEHPGDLPVLLEIAERLGAAAVNAGEAAGAPRRAR